MKKLMGFAVACLLLSVACSPNGGTNVADDNPTNTTAPLGTNVSIVFLHHSTGGIVWGNGVPEGFEAYNASNNVNYAITERAYPDTPYPWENYPYDYWNIWVNHAGPTAYDGQDTLEILTADYDVIIFKHCFPVSGVVEQTGAPDVTSSEKTYSNYILQYNAIKAKLHTFSQNRFIVWTGAALLESETTPENAGRAKLFFDWVKDTWDEEGDNIYVWDFYALETEGTLYLPVENSAGDSHPSDAFATGVAPLFVQRVVDVIEGRGDTGSLTGQ